MIRLSSVFWLLLASTTALATFAVKYEVQALDNRLTDARKATAAENRERRVLDAEWAYLNRPDMLAAMNQRFLSLAPITRKQLQTGIADIAMRPVAPPPEPTPAGAVPESAKLAALDRAPSPLPEAAPVAKAAPTSLPITAASAEGPAAAPGPPTASSPPRAVLIKASASVSTTPASSPRAKTLDRGSLDQLIARIAAGR
jgi:hypothetical protein